MLLAQHESGNQWLPGQCKEQISMYNNQPIIGEQREPITPEIRHFCELAARILLRCLKEQDPAVLKVLCWEPMRSGIASNRSKRQYQPTESRQVI